MLSSTTVARRLARYCLIGSLVLATSPLLADPPAGGGPTEELPDVDVTVQRIRQPKEDVAAPVTVITPAELNVGAGSSVADALRTVPGLDLRPAGSDSAIAGFSLRGAKAEQVLVLVDGRRVGTAQGGGVNLGDLPLADVERIEVLRGGASALFGTDPIGGVINIITKRSGDGRLRATLRGGSFGALGAQAGAGGVVGRATWRLDSEYYTQDGDFSYRGAGGTWATRDNNFLLRRYVTGRGGYNLGGAGQLEVGGELFRAHRGAPGLVTWPSATARQTDERRGAWLSHKVDLAPGTHLTSSLNWLDNLRGYQDPASFFPINDRHRNRQLSCEVLSTFDVASGKQAVVGASWRRDELNSTADGRHHRITGGLFGQYEIGLGALTLSPSARVDWQTGQKPIFMPRFGATWRATSNLTLRAGANRSFRAPSFDDLYWPADPWSAGNPNLVPETASEWNVGLGWQAWRGGKVDLDYYSRLASQLIAWMPRTDGVWTPTNIGSVRFQGLEVSVETPLPHLPKCTFTGSYAYLKATTHSGAAGELGKQLLYRPFHQGTAKLAWNGSRLGAELSFGTIGSRYTTADNTQALPGYATLDLSGRWRPTSRDELSLEIRNLTDVSYQAVQGYPLPGIEVRVAASRSF